MTRNVICNVTNNTSWAFSLGKWHLNHGQGTPKSEIEVSDSSQEIFSLHKTPASAQGTSGTISYTLRDGSELFFGFNCPYTADGTGGSSNCYFYACLTNIPDGGTEFAISCSVLVDNKPMNEQNPPTGDNVVATVTIDLASNSSSVRKRRDTADSITTKI